MTAQRATRATRGRRPAGSGTREAIAAAARHQFAEQGYPNTSLRSIAAEAGVDPRLVLHFFGSKQELFVAVVEFPFQPEAVFERVLGPGRDGVGLRLAQYFVGVLSDPDALRVVTGLVRAAASEEKAAELLRAQVSEQMLLPLADRLGTDNAQLRAGLVASQVVGMTMARHVVAIAPLAQATRKQLVSALAPVLQHYLTGDLSGKH